MSGGCRQPLGCPSGPRSSLQPWCWPGEQNQTSTVMLHWLLTPAGFVPTALCARVSAWSGISHGGFLFFLETQPSQTSLQLPHPYPWMLAVMLLVLLPIQLLFQAKSPHLLHPTSFEHLCTPGPRSLALRVFCPSYPIASLLGCPGEASL